MPQFNFDNLTPNFNPDETTRSRDIKRVSGYNPIKFIPIHRGIFVIRDQTDIRCLRFDFQSKRRDWYHSPYFRVTAPLFYQFNSADFDAGRRFSGFR